MMHRINILDTNRKPIPGARFTARSNSGTKLADYDVPASGYVLLDDVQDAVLFQDGVTFIASASGYYDTVFPAMSVVTGEYNFILEKKVNWLLPAVGIGLGAMLLLSGKKKRVSGLFDSMTPQTKNILIIGGLGIAAYYLVVKDLFPDKEDNTDLPMNAEAELHALIAAGHGPTISVTAASSYAATIVSAADDCGTDETAIMNVFSHIQNKADLLLLIVTYDIREYKGCFDGDYFGFHRRNLAETITTELSGGYIADVNDMLQSKGINFQF